MLLEQQIQLAGFPLAGLLKQWNATCTTGN